MSRIHQVRFALLTSILVVSIALNVFLYQGKQNYYLQLNEVRLDPLGLSAFPDEPPTLQPSDRPVIVFFGDSRAAEWPAPAEITDAIFINRGISAQTSPQVAGRFAQHIAPLHPDKVIVQVGINDVMDIVLFPEQRMTIIANCKANIRAIVMQSLDAGAQEVILTTVFPLGALPIDGKLFWASEVASAIEEINTFIRSLASDKVIVFDTGPVLVDADGVVQSKYSRDYLHLNADGYAALNRVLAQILSK